MSVISTQKHVERSSLRDTMSEAVSNEKPQVYVLPRRILARVFGAFLLRKQRNVWDDCILANDTLAKQPVIHGMENVPEEGPIVFLPNHYERKDTVWVGWGAIALTSALARQRDRTKLRYMHWVMTDTWADCYIGPFHLNPRYLGWILKGFGDVYGITRMPAHDLPNHRTQRGRSASSLREIFKNLERGACVAVHPEAGGFETLITPPPGAGRVLAAVERQGVTMIPVGVFEENDHLVINIGKPFAANSFNRKSDADAAATAMRTIAELVPMRNRGVWTEQDSSDERLAAD